MEQQVYSLEGTAQQLLAELERAHAQDKVAERQIALWRSVAGAGGALLLGGIVTIAFLTVLALVVIVLGVGLGVLGLVMASRKRRFDLDDRKLGAARRVISVLQADIPVSWPLGLTLDLRPYTEAGPPVEDCGDARRRWEQTWLELRSNLADGCSVVALLRDEVSRKEKSKRKGTRVVERFASEATIRLRLARQYGEAEALVARLQSTPPVHGWSIRSCRGQGRALWLTVATPPGSRTTYRGSTGGDTSSLADGDTLLQALHWAYGAIGAGRRAA
jgi:hypothetical protein